MKKIDYDKLQDSLEHIKTLCEDAQEGGGCVACPLGTSDAGCMLRKCPNRWTVRHPETDAFRVLE